MVTNARAITGEEFLRFNEQLLGLVRTNMPLDSGLRQVADEIGRGRLKDFVVSVSEQLDRGQQLSEALEKFRPQLSEYYLSLVRAGERGGSLAEVLHHIVTETRRQIDHRRALVSSLAYPASVVIVAITIVTLVLFTIIPQFVDTYRELGAELPVLTRAIIDFHKWVISNIFGVLAVGAMAVAAVIAFVRGYIARHFRDALLLWMPVVGQMVTNDIIITFTRCMGFLLVRKVPAGEALGLTRSVISNVIAQDFVGVIREGVERGISFSDMLDRNPYLPMSMRWMIRLAQDRGDLGETLGDIADFYQTKQEHLRRAFRGIIEPGLIVLVGILVGTVIIALYLPIFTIPKLIR